MMSDHEDVCVSLPVELSSGLLLLPPELVARVCLSLPSATLAAMERSCSSLRRRLAAGGVWAARARRVDKAKAYSFVTRLLAVVTERGEEDQRVFKVVLGVRAVIRRASYSFLGSIMEQEKETEIYHHCATSPHFSAARQQFMSKKMTQFKAWSGLYFEDESEYDKLDNHFTFSDEVLSCDEFDVAKVLERMEEEARRRFVFNLEEVMEGVRRRCLVIAGEHRA